MLMISIAILAVKECSVAVVIEDDAEKMMLDQVKIDNYVHSYYHKMHILHTLSLISAFLIVLLSFIDLVPKHNDDVKYAFHFVVSGTLPFFLNPNHTFPPLPFPLQSIFIIFGISLATIYASMVAFNRPCMVAENSICCKVITTPSLFTEGKTLTAISANDIAMVAIMFLDLASGLLMFIVSIFYFRDVRQDAEQCGYLYRVHNEGYIIR